MTPGAYRRLGRATGFELSLPAGFSWHDLFGLFGRSSGGLCERIDGDRATKILSIGGATLRVDLADRAALGAILAQVTGAHAVTRLVNCAGVALLDPIEDLDPQDFPARWTSTCSHLR